MHELSTVVELSFFNLQCVNSILTAMVEEDMVCWNLKFNTSEATYMYITISFRQVVYAFSSYMDQRLQGDMLQGCDSAVSKEVGMS